ncbi:hypothetical protein GCM10010507_09690 [Streptomyces cinnamoneus]|uniref:Uncharacterized protein n=1 Tax=Streptomyces cinnamoneus TaxID=53446 RepID=A0A918TAQ0_STRCJ|nr:hypothetical protein GCM10010507_09690 [Streptomyces cinnamoneus]
MAEAAAVQETWWLMQGDTRVGALREYAVDQPSFLCHSVPGSGWEAVCGQFESWAGPRGPDPDGARTMQVVKPIMDLG